MIWRNSLHFASSVFYDQGQSDFRVVSLRISSNCDFKYYILNVLYYQFLKVENITVRTLLAKLLNFGVKPLYDFSIFSLERSYFLNI